MVIGGETPARNLGNRARTGCLGPIQQGKCIHWQVHELPHRLKRGVNRQFLEVAYNLFDAFQAGGGCWFWAEDVEAVDGRTFGVFAHWDCASLDFGEV